MTGVNLYATNLYGKIASQELSPTPFNIAQDSQKVAGQFHDMVKVEFNKLASLNPTQLISQMNVARINLSSSTNELNISSNLLSGVGDLRRTLVKQEKESQKAAIGKANLTELMTATVQAQNVLTTIVTLRDKMVEAWDKVMNLQV